MKVSVQCVQFYNTSLRNRQFKQTNRRAAPANEELIDNIALDLGNQPQILHQQMIIQHTTQHRTLDIDGTLINTALSDDGLTDSTILDIDSSAASI